MILSGWAKLIEEHAPFNGERVNSVEIAIGRNKQNKRVKYFCLTRRIGRMFATQVIAKYEIHRLHDVFKESDEDLSVRQWLMTNIERTSLHQHIQTEKRSFLTCYAKYAKRVVSLEFDKREFNSDVGMSPTVSEDEISDFFLHNTFSSIDGEDYTCVGVSISNNLLVTT